MDGFFTLLEFKLLPYIGVDVKYSVFVKPTGSENGDHRPETDVSTYVEGLELSTDLFLG
jgi:hypothetical protein